MKKSERLDLSDNYDEVLKEFIGKEIHLSLGQVGDDKEIADGQNYDVLESGTLKSVRGRWAEIEKIKEFEGPEIRWFNLDRVDYFSLDEPDFFLDGGKKKLRLKMDSTVKESGDNE